MSNGRGYFMSGSQIRGGAPIFYSFHDPQMVHANWSFNSYRGRAILCKAGFARFLSFTLKDTPRNRVALMDRATSTVDAEHTMTLQGKDDRKWP